MRNRATDFQNVLALRFFNKFVVSVFIYDTRAYISWDIGICKNYITIGTADLLKM